MSFQPVWSPSHSSVCVIYFFFLSLYLPCAVCLSHTVSCPLSGFQAVLCPGGLYTMSIIMPVAAPVPVCIYLCISTPPPFPYPPPPCETLCWAGEFYCACRSADTTHCAVDNGWDIWLRQKNNLLCSGFFRNPWCRNGLPSLLLALPTPPPPLLTHPHAQPSPIVCCPIYAHM